MPTRRQILSITLASAAFLAMAVTAANLNKFETTKSDLGHSIAAAQAATGVTVAWVTDYDPLLGGDKVVGATLIPANGAILADSSIKLTIVGADGVDLGTISSHDGGDTWSELTEPVAASDSLVASVVIDDRETVAAVSRQ
jgi:hypothetical protein